jgi:hypothetical protein
MGKPLSKKIIDVFYKSRKIALMFGNLMKKRRLFFFVIFALSVLPVFAQKSKNTEIKRINAYVKTINAFVEKKKPHIVFADTSDYNETSKPKWRKFASEKVLEKFRETSETYTIAYNWRKSGRLIQSNFTLFSPSGDWTQYDFYYFRPNGTIAKIASELRTFMGDLIVLRDFYFDGKGKPLRQTTRYRDLNTNKTVKKPNDGDFQTTEVEIYKTVRQLPFAKLIK